MKRKILIDAIGIDRVGGGRTAICTLLEHILRLDQETSFTVLVSGREQSWDKYSNVHQRVISGRRFAVRAYLQCVLPTWTHREGIALVHFAKNLGVFGLSCPYVVTVHDLTTLLLYDQHTLLDVAYWKWVEALTVRKAARVVAVSHDTARDIERFYRISQRKVEVIHWAPHARFRPVRDSCQLEALRRRYRLPTQYVLFVGILAKKKNVPTLLSSMAKLYSRMPNAPDLVVVGRQYPQSEDTVSTALVHQLGLDGHVHFLGSVPDEDLPGLFTASAFYVLPSLHEGFGIPCLEAMACGVPVIVTRAGALPEIVGDAAWILDDPMDAVGLSTAMECVLRDGTLRQEMVRRGFERAAAFSWEKSARKMLEVYQAVLEGR